MSTTDTTVPLPGLTALFTVTVGSTGLVVVQVGQVPVLGTTLIGGHRRGVVEVMRADGRACGQNASSHLPRRHATGPQGADRQARANGVDQRFGRRRDRIADTHGQRIGQRAPTDTIVPLPGLAPLFPVITGKGVAVTTALSLRSQVGFVATSEQASPVGLGHPRDVIDRCLRRSLPACEQQECKEQGWAVREPPRMSAQLPRARSRRRVGRLHHFHRFPDSDS